MKDTILYIDDEQANLDAFRMVFGKQYNIILSSNFKEVLKLVKSGEKIKIVIADQRMPDITGLDLCERINKLNPNIICIILTAYADLGIILQAINQSGIFRFLIKPWEKEQMNIELKNAIDKFNLKEENKDLIETLKQKNKELEEAKINAEKNETLFKLFLDKLPLPTTLLDHDQNVLFTNEKLTEVIGYSAKEIDTMDKWWLAAYPDEAYRNTARTKWESAVLNSLKTNISIEPQVWNIQTKFGTELRCQFFMIPVREYFLVVINDISSF